MADKRTDAQRLVDLTLEAKQKPQYEQLMDYLSVRRSVPPTKFGYLGKNDGLYERNTAFGNELPRTGVITLQRNSDANTFVHELTHAAAAQLASQYAEGPTSFGRPNKPTQFTQAFEKIMLGEPGVRDSAPIAQARALDPAWTDANKNYRSTAGELLGFAMGNSAPTGGKIRNFASKVPQHLDATLATQMMILLDLATRAQKAENSTTKQGR